MIQLSIAGQAVELSRHDFLSLLDHIAAGYYVLAEAYQHYHINGFADWKNALPRTLEMVGWETPMETVETQIDDEELHEAFHSLREHLQELISIDEQIIDWLAAYAGLSSSQGESNRRRMDRRLHKIVVDEGPIWAMEPEYQVFAGKSEQEMRAVMEVKQRMDRRLEQLMGRSGEDGDALTGGKSSSA
jgi:hypothetical protein